MFWVYVIQNDQDSEMYIGFTTDIKQRISEHNNGGKKFTTRKKGVWRLIYAELYRSERDAREREQKLKQHGGSKRQLLKRIKNSCLSPKMGLDAAKVSLPTVYQKHSSLRTRKSRYRG